MVAAGATLWGCWPLFLRLSQLTGVQNALVALVGMSLPAPFLLRREALRDRRATLALAGVGLSDAANAAFFFAAVQRGPLAVAVLTHYLAPLLMALLAPWVLKERRSLRALVGAPVTLFGLALLIGAPQGGLSAWTAVLGSASALFFAANILGSKEAGRAYSPLAVASLHAPISVLALLLVFGRAALPPALDGSVLSVLAGGVLCSLIGTAIFNTGLRRVPTTAAGTLSYVEPLTASVIGWAVFGEALGPWGLVGGALVLLAGVWVASEPKAPEPVLPVVSGAP
jgi:drug/metabolite transporter (DMT)-like permease